MKNNDNSFWFPCVIVTLISYTIYASTMFIYLDYNNTSLFTTILIMEVFIILFLSVISSFYSYKILGKRMHEFKFQNNHLLVNNIDFDLTYLKGFYYRLGKFYTRKLIGRVLTRQILIV